MELCETKNIHNNSKASSFTTINSLKQKYKKYTHRKTRQKRKTLRDESFISLTKLTFKECLKCDSRFSMNHQPTSLHYHYKRYCLY